MSKLIIEKLKNVKDLKNLILVFSSAFESEYSTDDNYLESMISDKSNLILGAFVDGNIVGGLVAFELKPIHGSKEFYIYDIAVAPANQRQGIGYKLIESLKEEAKNRNIEIIFVETEADDERAVNFYRAIGGVEEAVKHFNFPVI